MATQKKNLAKPDESRPFPKGKIDVVKVGDLTFGKATFQPGWKWSECVKPIAGTKSCMVNHNGYILSGKMHIRMDDGSEVELGAGDVFVCPPGHDAWVPGNEPCVAYDFAGASIYAKKVLLARCGDFGGSAPGATVRRGAAAAASRARDRARPRGGARVRARGIPGAAAASRTRGARARTPRRCRRGRCAEPADSA